MTATEIAMLADLAEYLAKPDTSHHDVNADSGVRQLANRYLMIVDELTYEQRRRHDAECRAKRAELELAQLRQRVGDPDCTREPVTARGAMTNAEAALDTLRREGLL